MSNSRTLLLALACVGATSAAYAVDITTLDGSQGWLGNGFAGGGVAQIVSTPTNDGDGSLWMTGDRSRATFFTGSSLGTLGSLAAGTVSFDLYRDSGSTGAAGYHIAFKLHLVNENNESGSLTWENAYNGNNTLTGAWINDQLLSGAGQWWIRSGNFNFDQVANMRTLADWTTGGSVTSGANTSIVLGANTQITAIELAVGSGVPGGTFLGAADDVRVLFDGGNQYQFNFTPVPEPGTIAALGLGIAALLRRRALRK